MTTSSNGDVKGQHGGHDVWVVKISNTGTILWQNCLGGTLPDYSYGMCATADNGFLLVGGAESFDGNLDSNKGSCDAWIMKIDPDGKLTWDETIGGTEYDLFNAVAADSGNIIVVGETSSNNGDILDSHGSTDYLSVRFLNDKPVEVRSFIKQSQITISPNPFSEYIVVNCPVEFIDNKYSLTDIFGRKVKTGTVTELLLTIKMSDLLPGCYYMTVEGTPNQRFKLLKTQ